MRYLLIHLPLQTVSELNRRDHWRVVARRKQVQKQAVAVILRAEWGHCRGPWTAPLTVTLTRIGPRMLDSDNLQSALKYCRDEVARWLGLDDADPLLVWVYGQRTGRSLRKGVPYYAVEIQLGEESPEATP